MSERINNTNRAPALDRPDDDQAPWLELARRQANTAAEIRSQAVAPFDWDAVDSKQPSAGWLGGLFGPAAPGRMRLSWALPALALVVLGGGAGTLAYVHHRTDGAAARDTIILDHATHPAGPSRAPARRSVELEQYLKPVPPPEPKKKPERVRRPMRKRPASKKARRRTVVARKKAAKQPEKPATKKPTSNGDIIFGHTDMPGGGEVIIVRPPSKLGPLFRTKDFKKGGPYGSRK